MAQSSPSAAFPGNLSDFFETTRMGYGAGWTGSQESLKVLVCFFLCEVVMNMWQNGSKSKGLWILHPPAGIGWLGFHMALAEVMQHQISGCQECCGT